MKQRIMPAYRIYKIMNMWLILATKSTGMVETCNEWIASLEEINLRN